jgi:asparagine synthase (glutamine-hydrolysing)
MCGIAGFCDFTKKLDKNILIKMTDILHHRGSDDSGYIFYKTNDANIGLGHRRLSILDLSNHGHQPMKYESLNIAYNGEIYNFKEIRVELEKYNYIFESENDTEVILKAYHKWGIKAVDKFNGMFAIAIYDIEKEKLIFIRDRAGVKPFYYYDKNNLFMFSSELKSFHENDSFNKEIDIDALALYLQYGYIPQPYTIFIDTHKLKSGHYMELDLKSKNISIVKYWDVIDLYNKPKLNINENEAIAKTEKLLKSAFEYRMVSDVPVGIFLSGGYDSSLVTAIIQKDRKEKLNTFTIGFEEKGFDEAPYAKQVANYLGTNHTEYYCTAEDAIEIIPKLSEIYDEPFGDSSAIPTLLVSQLAKKDVTVSLSSDAGDEIFAGYNKYTNIINSYSMIKKIPNFFKFILKYDISEKLLLKILNILKVKNSVMRIKKIVELLDTESITENLSIVSKTFQLNELDILLNKNIIIKKTNFNNNAKGDLLNILLATDYQTYMTDNILVKVDRATMHFGLEGREPLLDHRIIEFTSQIPSKIKYKNGIKKNILKEITHKYLPKNMMDRPKKGFNVPIQDWFKEDLKYYLEEFINEKELKEHNLFNIEYVLKLKYSYFENNDNVNKLWYILTFQMWYKRWM